jgi:uncharacterized protein with ATP-grasp and redox domains
MSDELRENLQTADIVIAKGRANYYALSEYRPKARGKIACLWVVQGLRNFARERKFEREGKVRKYFP